MTKQGEGTLIWNKTQPKTNSCVNIVDYQQFFSDSDDSMQLQQSSHAEMMRVLNVLDKTLEPRTFLVGDSLTLADIAVATAALLPFKYVSQVFNIYPI